MDISIFSTHFILEKLKGKFSYPQRVCMTCSSILNRRIAKPSSHKKSIRSAIYHCKHVTYFEMSIAISKSVHTRRTATS